MAAKLGDNEVGVLNDYVNMWTKSIEQLLDRLKDTVPGDGMIGEVHYWRDLSRILDGISAELKQPQVEMTVQILLMRVEKDKQSSISTNVLESDIKQFSTQKSRVMKGAKEARWNNKYMKIIEKPVQQIEKATDLYEIEVVIVALLKSLKNIYENSNFYKEARIVSFVDRLLVTITNKLKNRFGLQKSVMKGLKDHANFEEELESGIRIVQKFKENFFIAQIMQE